MFWGIRWDRLRLFGLVAMAGLLGAGYLILSRGAQSSITQQLLDRQAVIARADAGNIKSFFQAVGNSVALRAQMRSMERQDPTTAEDLDAFVNQWGDGGLVSGIVLTDSRGVVAFNSNIEGTRDVGKSLADRDYFVWAKNQKEEGEYFVGAPVVSKLGATEGQVIVTVASPVFAKDVFLGVVTAAVKLASLAQRNLELLKFSELTSMYLVEQDGDLLYSSPGSEVLSDDIVGALNAAKQGKLVKEGRLIAYSPVALSSQNWLVIVSAPIGEVSSLTIPFYIRQAAVLISVSLATLAFGIYVSRQSQKRLE